MLASIRDIEGARVAGWGVAHTGTFGGWVWLTGNEAPSVEAARVADAHSDVEIRLGAVHSYSELLAAQDGLFDDIGPTGHVGSEGLADVEQIVTYTGINMSANAIRIGIDPGLVTAKAPGGLDDTGPVAVTDEAFQTKASEVTKLLQGAIDINYVIEDGRNYGSDATFGGGQPIGDCTAGFAARENGGGAYGIITAGHCGVDGPDETATMQMHGVTLPFVTGWASDRADAQFHRIPTGSSHNLRDDFVCLAGQSTTWCDVTTDIARSQMIPRDRTINDYVCHTGRSSGISCGSIRDINHQPRHSRACWSSSNVVVECRPEFVLVRGASLKGCHGDSGGPWYRGTVAYGIHKSSTGGDNCKATNVQAIFSAIREVESFLRVQILTGSSQVIN